MAKVTYDSVVAELKSRKNSIKRSELISLLEGLRFKVQPGTKGKHYTYNHRDFAIFPGGTFNGSHDGKDPIIKVPYILDAIKILMKYEAELIVLCY